MLISLNKPHALTDKDEFNVYPAMWFKVYPAVCDPDGEMLYLMVRWIKEWLERFKVCIYGWMDLWMDEWQERLMVG